MKALTDINLLDFSKTYSYADYLKWEFQDRLELIKGKSLRCLQHLPLEINKFPLKFLAEYGFFWKVKDCQVFAAPFDVRLPVKSKKNEDVETVV